MKKTFLLLFLITMPFTAWSISQNFSFSCRTRVFHGDQFLYENRTYTYSFNMDIVSDNYGCKSGSYYRKPFIRVNPGERYSVVLHNPLPVRVAVNLMIDGLNSVTGSPCGPSGGTKWLIAPNSSITVRGWQVNSNNLRRFYFTSRSDSYAQWRSHQLGQDLTVKCGVISAAYFWNRSELENYFCREPKPYPCRSLDSRADNEGISRKRKCMEENREQAGTGMGERNAHSVTEVNFHYDMGMYQPYQAVTVYYDFFRSRPYPYRSYGNYAPEK